MIEAIRHFEIYLFGSQFTVVTDHKALTNLFSSTVLNAKLWRWAMYLQQFDITFRYLPGRFNVVADCLSRQTWPSTQTSSELPDAFTTSSGGIRRNLSSERKNSIPKLVFTKTDLYLNRGEMWEYSHHTRTLPQYNIEL